MTEPQGGADPLVLKTKAELDGEHWVINGEKWFASNAKFAGFFIIMAVTDPDASAYRRMSMFIVPADTPGIEIIRNHGFYGEPEHTHAHLRWTNVRVPIDNMLGERAVSSFTKGEQLSQKQMVQEKIADSWVELRQFRLLVLETAWLADQGHDWKALRKNVAAFKSIMPKLLHDISARALHIHGSLGISHEMPFAEWVIDSFHVGLADGPTEVHKVTVAREVLKDVQPAKDMFPDYIGYEQDARAQ